MYYEGMKTTRIGMSMLVLIVAGWVWGRNKSVEAAVEACGASASPSSVQTSVNTNFSFSLTNNGSNPITYFQVAVPTADFSIQGKDASGWSGTSSANLAQFWGGSLAPGATLNFTILAGSGGTEIPSNNWIVDANDVLSTDGMTRCTGSLGVAISGVSDVVGPVISDSTVTNITANSVVINWSTNESANSLVYYGLGSGVYGLSAEDGSYVTSHRVTLTAGLAASTTYYYYVCSLDQSGNQSCGDENLFTTAAASTATAAPVAAVTPTPTPVPTTTTTAKASPSPTPYVDRVVPVVEFAPELENPYEEPPEMIGKASDNVGVVSVYYSTDGGANWVRVEQVEGLGSREVGFSFVPEISEDGNYEIVVRALDGAGNEGASESYTLVLDRLPPRVGASLLSMGPYALLPNRDGVMVTIVGVEEKISLSAVGGATSIDLIAEYSGEGETKMFSLGKNGETGLWGGAVYFSKSGLYRLKARAEDGAGNKTERELGLVLAVARGQVESGDGRSEYEEGVIRVYSRDEGSRLWSLWDARAFGQKNPQQLSGEGRFQYYLPPGTYYLQVEMKGLPKLTSEIFSLTSSLPLNPILRLPEREYFVLGPIRIPKPDWLMPKAKVILTAPKTEGLVVGGVMGEPVAPFSLEQTDGQVVTEEQYLGRAHVMTFVTSWSPQSLEQIALLSTAVENGDLPLVVVAGQETKSRMKVLLKRGGYELPVVADVYGELTEAMGVVSVPTHYLVGKSGEIEKVVVGVLTEGEVRELLGG